MIDVLLFYRWTPSEFSIRKTPRGWQERHQNNQLLSCDRGGRKEEAISFTTPTWGGGGFYVLCSGF